MERRRKASRVRRHGSQRHYHLMLRYGLAEAEVDAMAERQGGLCAICLRDLGDRPHVDPDHDTGDVRGLLCFTCNVGLGNFSDDVERLESAAEYLRSQPRVSPSGPLGPDELRSLGWRVVFAG